jgi:hypothetical protein
MSRHCGPLIWFEFACTVLSAGMEFTQHAVAAEQKIALVIGNSAYLSVKTA